MAVDYDMILPPSSQVLQVPDNETGPECALDKAHSDECMVAAAVESVTQWKFLGASVWEFPVGVAKNENCSGDNVQVTAMPIKVSYVFDFSSQSGRAPIKSRRATN